MDTPAPSALRYTYPKPIPEGFTQRCRVCDDRKPAETFGRRKGQNCYWLSTVCKPCFALKKKAERQIEPDRYKRWYKASERRNQAARCDKVLQKQYSITLEIYLNILRQQDGGCATCHGLNELKDGRIRRFEVDHDHTCCNAPTSCGACVRGLLCARCNSLLGKAKDDLYLLAALVDYLQRSKPMVQGESEENA